MKTQLLCTFCTAYDLEEVVELIKLGTSIVFNKVYVFENVENANALKKNINNYFPAYTEALPNNNALTAVYVGPFRTKEDIDKNIDFIYEISETNSGEVVLWKP